MGVEKDSDSWCCPLPRITKGGTRVCRRAREKLCQMSSDGTLWRKSREQVAFSSSCQ